MTSMDLLPLSPPQQAWFPHVLESSGHPPVSKPILESQVLQLSSLLPRIPIPALEQQLLKDRALNPSLLQPVCKDAWEPISVFHVLRPREVLRYCQSAIKEYRESACLFMTNKIDLLVDLHTKADLGEGCVPVGR